jgi:hypothetical protein
MVVDVDVCVTIVVRVTPQSLTDDQNRCRLSAAAIAADRVSRLERGVQALGQLPVSILECLGHRSNNLGPGQNVALCGISCSFLVPSPVLRIRPRKHGDVAPSVYDRNLPATFPGKGVFFKKTVHYLLSCQPTLQ